MNEYIKAAEELVYLNGIDVTYVSVVEGTYDSNTGSVTNTETETVVKGYPKNVRVNSYNYPNLIGREVQEYIIVSKDLSSYPKPQDKIKRGSVVYTVDSVRDITAEGESVIYKILVVK